LLKLLSTAVWPTPTGRDKRVYSLGRRRVDLIEAKRRIAYIGAELQDKYARYEWNLTVCDMLATGLHRTDLLQQPVNSGRTSPDHRDAQTLRSDASAEPPGSRRCRMGKSGWPCWRAAWSRTRIGYCWMSSITAWTWSIAAESTAYSIRRAPAARLG